MSNNKNIKKIYLVTGTTGKYEDVNIWNIRSFIVKDRAEYFIIELNNYLKLNGIGLDGEEYSKYKYPESFDGCPDPFLKDYLCTPGTTSFTTGITYQIKEIALYG